MVPVHCQMSYEIAPLQQALETRFFPHVESLGFVRDKRQEPRIACFRRRTDSAMQVFAILWEKRGRPRFIVQFAETPLSGIDAGGKHFPAEDVSPGHIGLLRGWLHPPPSDMWFRLDDQSLWGRLVSRKRSDPNQVVDFLLKLFPEVIEWWEKKTKGPHLKVLPAISLPPMESEPPADGGAFSFRYILAEYRCTGCTTARSLYEITLSAPYVAIAFFSAVALSFVLLHAPWSFPWYYFFCIFAGELLALFIAGLPLSLFFIGGGSLVHRCPDCGAPMTLRGRHFTKSQKPRWTDAVLLSLFCALNLVVWVNLYHHI